MDLDLSNAEFADPCIELGADLEIKYHGLTARFTLEDMKEVKRGGWPTNIMSCILNALMSTGMSYEKARKFMEEARKCHAHIDFKFIIVEGKDERELTPAEHKRALDLLELSVLKKKMKNMRPS